MPLVELGCGCEKNDVLDVGGGDHGVGNDTTGTGAVGVSAVQGAAAGVLAGDGLKSLSGELVCRQ